MSTLASAITSVPNFGTSSPFEYAPAQILKTKDAMWLVVWCKHTPVRGRRSSALLAAHATHLANTPPLPLVSAGANVVASITSRSIAAACTMALRFNNAATVSALRLCQQQRIQ